jgi:hypothetical protein
VGQFPQARQLALPNQSELADDVELEWLVGRHGLLKTANVFLRLSSAARVHL